MSAPSAKRRTNLAAPPSPTQSAPVGADAKEPEEERDSAGTYVTEFFTWCMLAISLTVWAIVGMFLWLPRLFRSGLWFSVALIYGTIVDRDMKPAANRLRSDVDFYRRGFVKAVQSTRETEGGGSEEDWEITASPLLTELAWALVLWYPVFLWIGVAEMTPAEIWALIADFPWMETLNRIGDQIASALRSVRNLLVEGLVG